MSLDFFLRVVLGEEKEGCARTNISVWRLYYKEKP